MKKILFFNSLAFMALVVFVVFFAAAKPVSTGGESANFASNIQETFATVVENAAPSVVVIRIGKQTADAQEEEELEGDNGGGNLQSAPRGPQDLFKEFFNPKRLRGQGQRLPQQPARPLGQASGFFIRDNGYIVTNNHVVVDQTDFTVILKDGRKFKADVVGADPKTDLAVLKIKSDEKFPTLKFADSDKVKIGYWAIAIGAPFTLDYTVTIGVVSHKGRPIGLNIYENYIQTDAAINPGNSGGPLLGVNGEVMGVVDFIMTPPTVRGNIGVSFAIASNLAKDVTDQIVAHGEVVRAWIGITMEPVSAEIRKELKIEGGALVREIRLGDPADKAGLKPGDVILKIDGEPVKDSRDVQAAILKRKPGDKIKFAIKRQGVDQEIEVVAGKQKSREMAGASDVGDTIGGIYEKYGIRLGEKDGQILIQETLKGGIAEKAGLRRGMMVYSINKEQVRSMDDVAKIAEEAIKEKYLLLYVGDGSSTRQYFALSLR